MSVEKSTDISVEGFVNYTWSEDSVPENAKKVTKSVVEITEWVYTKTIILFNLGE